MAKKQPSLRDLVSQRADLVGSTIQDMAALCSISRPHFYRIIDGHVAPTERMVERLAAGLKASKSAIVAAAEASQRRLAAR